MFPALADRRLRWGLFGLGGLTLFASATLVRNNVERWTRLAGERTPTAEAHALDLIHAGRRAFRFGSLEDTTCLSQSLRLHDAIKGATLRGVGPGLSPAQALALGWKIDTEKLSPELQMAILANEIDMMDPVVTVELIRLNAIVGITGIVQAENQLTSLAIQCAACHSTVDDSLAPGIGRRLDGWANRDLDIGKLLAMAPGRAALASPLECPEANVREVLQSWGPGKLDARLFRSPSARQSGDDAPSGAVLIPSLFDLAGVSASGHMSADRQGLTPTLAALQFYLWSLPAPKPPSWRDTGRRSSAPAQESPSERRAFAVSD